MSDTMTKDDIVRDVVDANSGVSRETARVVFETIFDAISVGLKDGKRVRIPEFATLEAKGTSARTGRNPNTGEAINIPAGRRVSFKAAKALREIL